MVLDTRNHREEGSVHPDVSVQAGEMAILDNPDPLAPDILWGMDEMKIDLS